jgi:hypothetical protein
MSIRATLVSWSDWRRWTTAAKTHPYCAVGIAIAIAWGVPLLLTRNQVDWGDFGYFAQVHEAIKLNILEYHQFPWWNPWVLGGYPLYANPQAGVFSLPTLLSLFFMPAFALKLTICLFYVLGYLSMYQLLRHLRVGELMSALLAIVWITNGFFVAHLPAHFTFIWLLVLPWFIYRALILYSLHSSVILGLGITAMALAQVHYSFIMVCCAVATVVMARLAWGGMSRKGLMQAVAAAFGLVVIIAGHRILSALEFTSSLPKDVLDPTSSMTESLQSFIVPLGNNYQLIRPLGAPFYGWNEQAAYSSIFMVVASLVAVVLLVYIRPRWNGVAQLKRLLRRSWYARTLTAVAGLLLLSFLVGLGNLATFMPYHFLKLLPVFDGMRVSARWFIFTMLGLLLLVGLATVHRRSQGFARFLILALSCMAALDLLTLNYGYQSRVLNHLIALPPKETSHLTFQQQIRFGESSTSPDGLPIAFTNRQYTNREYESTLFNIGTLLANEAHVNIYDNETPRCSYVAGCGLVLSHNADVAIWSPNKIILKRTAPGKIELNMNNSSYFKVNGKRQSGMSEVDRFHHFILPVDDRQSEITITVEPRAPLFN